MLESGYFISGLIIGSIGFFIFVLIAGLITELVKWITKVNNTVEQMDRLERELKLQKFKKDVSK